MTAIPASRVNYFERQYLRLAEFQDEQAYHIALRRRHNLSHHWWGIVVGLELVLEQKVPVVRPGLAIDGYGRELLLLDRFTVDRPVFDRYGTNRLDLWLEYDLAGADAGAPPAVCDPTRPRQEYRAIERARVVVERASAAPVDPRRPEIVPAEDLDAVVGETPDDPQRRWPVYLGRLSMKIPETGTPEYTIVPASLAYIGLNAELIDHPGNAARIELGHVSDPIAGDTRDIGGTPCTYEGEAGREFAVFVPPTDGDLSSLKPTISVTPAATQIRGTTVVHGNLVLDGSSLLFPAGVAQKDVKVDEGPAIYRVTAGGDELRIDFGDSYSADRKLVLGLTKDGQFQPALEIAMEKGKTAPTVRIAGDFRVEGTFMGNDIRLRTLSQDLIPQLAAMLQMGILSGGA
jgi:hypothetical protein